MSTPAHYTTRQIPADGEPLLDALLSVFGAAFDDAHTYGAHRPRPAYVRKLLGSESFIALVACQDSQVIGGLAAYVLQKFEQERSEIYIYDLAVASAHRRQGVATRLIRELQRMGAQRGAWVVFVQADPPDAPAIALYSKLGVREDVLHFDIPLRSA